MSAEDLIVLLRLGFYPPRALLPPFLPLRVEQQMPQRDFRLANSDMPAENGPNFTAHLRLMLLVSPMVFLLVFVETVHKGRQELG
jgi:hypothetical protein